MLSTPTNNSFLYKCKVGPASRAEEEHETNSAYLHNLTSHSNLVAVMETSGYRRTSLAVTADAGSIVYPAQSIDLSSGLRTGLEFQGRDGGVAVRSLWRSVRGLFTLKGQST